MRALLLVLALLVPLPPLGTPLDVGGKVGVGAVHPNGGYPGVDRTTHRV